MQTFCCEPYLEKRLRRYLRSTRIKPDSTLRISASRMHTGYIPHISNERGLDVDLGLSVLEQIGRIVEIVDRGLYEEYQGAAHSRIGRPDPDDWPVVATA